MKIKTNQLIVGALMAATMYSCSMPKAISVNSKLDKNLPGNFAEAIANGDSSSGMVPWKQFYSDPNLVRLIDTALRNNQELMITLQNIEIAKSDVLLANGKLKPTASIGGGAGLRKAARYTSEGAGDASTQMKPGTDMPDPLPNFEVGIAADWEADIWHKLRTEKQSAVAHYLSTVEGKNFVLSSLIAEVANNYYELLALDNQLDIIQKYITLQDQALAISKIQKQAAAATELAVKKFEAELAKAKASEYDIRQQIVEKENDLNGLLGRFPQHIQRDKNVLMATSPQTVQTGIPSQLLTNRPDIKAAELELSAAKLDVEAARKEFLPSLGLSAGVGLEAFNPAYFAKLPESIASNIIGDLTGPLINKSAIQAKFNQANAMQVQSLYEYDKTILNAFLKVSGLVSKIKNLDDYYKLKKQESQALDESIDIANQLFKNSRADYLEVLLNQRDALEAKMELIEAKSKQMTAVSDIFMNLGGGWR